jgi:hypothetical protein
MSETPGPIAAFLVGLLVGGALAVIIRRWRK